jgi:hypothetical protein
MVVDRSAFMHDNGRSEEAIFIFRKTDYALQGRNGAILTRFEGTSNACGLIIGRIPLPHPLTKPILFLVCK